MWTKAKILEFSYISVIWPKRVLPSCDSLISLLHWNCKNSIYNLHVHGNGHREVNKITFQYHNSFFFFYHTLVQKNILLSYYIRRVKPPVHTDYYLILYWSCGLSARGLRGASKHLPLFWELSAFCWGPSLSPQPVEILGCYSVC